MPLVRRLLFWRRMLSSSIRHLVNIRKPGSPIRRIRVNTLRDRDSIRPQPNTLRDNKVRTRKGRILRHSKASIRKVRTRRGNILRRSTARRPNYRRSNWINWFLRLPFIPMDC